LHLAASQREGERVQAVKSGSQASSLVKYLEQREVSLLHSLQETRKQHGNIFFFVIPKILLEHSFCLFCLFLVSSLLCFFFLIRDFTDEKCREMTTIIDEQRSIIQTLKEEYAALIEDFQKSLVTNDS
jgi:hypothetical protein